MRKTAIAVWGGPSQGKSSSVREIVTRIHTVFLNALIDFRVKGEVDVLTLITIGRFKIGIESQGAPDSRLDGSLQLFIKEQCDVIVCAVPEGEGTLRSMERLRVEGYDILRTSNYFCRDKDSHAVNELFADHILLLIREILRGRI